METIESGQYFVARSGMGFEVRRALEDIEHAGQTEFDEISEGFDSEQEAEQKRVEVEKLFTKALIFEDQMDLPKRAA